MPTPSAPPNTDSTVRSMPTAGKATNTARIKNTVRAALESAMRNDRFICVTPISRLSTTRARVKAAMTATTITAVAWNSSHSEKRWLPDWNDSASIAAWMRGSRPVMCSANAPQISQAKLRSHSLSDSRGSKI